MDNKGCIATTVIANMISVIGLGNIGSLIATKLSESNDVVALDSEKKKLEGLRNVKGIAGSIMESADIIKKSDLVVVALPGQISNLYVKKLLEWGLDVVDVSYSPEDPYDLDKPARSTGSLYVPDCGFAPGMSNMLAYNLYSKYNVQDIEIIVGGLPEEAREPFLHSVTWSVEGLIDEYTRKAKVISNYKVKSLNPLDEIGSLILPGLGEFEYFISDGLRTLLSTLKIRNLSEKTIRIKGHLDKMKVLRDLGYFSDEKIDGTTARKLSEQIFSRFKTEGRDVCILIARSTDGSKSLTLTAKGSVDHTAMSLLTGLPAVSVSKLIIEGNIEGTGMLPPELISENSKNLSYIIRELTASGVDFKSNT